MSERVFFSPLSSSGDVKGYDSHASLYGVGEQQTSGSIDLLVLLLDVAWNLLQNLEKKTQPTFDMFI